MVRRYFVDDSDNTISGLTDIDEVEVPTGHSAVLESTIRAVDPPGADGRIRSGSTWDGSTYTAATPDGLLIPYDADTELGRKQIASTILHQYLKGVTEGIHAVRHEKPQADVEKVEQFIAMAHWATYVAAHMGMLIDNFETWVATMATGPSSASTVQEYFQSVHGLGDAKIPTQACAWVSLTDQTEVVGLDTARTESTAGTPATDTVATFGWFQGEMVELTDVHLGDGAWIRSLTA